MIAQLLFIIAGILLTEQIDNGSGRLTVTNSSYLTWKSKVLEKYSSLYKFSTNLASFKVSINLENMSFITNVKVTRIPVTSLKQRKKTV